MWGLAIHVYPFFNPTILQGQFPTCATGGRRVWWHKHIPPTLQTPPTVDVLRPTSLNPPLVNVHPPRQFLRCTIYQTWIMWFYTRLFSNYVTRVGSVNFQAPFTHPQKKLRAFNTVSTPPNPLQPVRKLGCVAHPGATQLISSTRHSRLNFRSRPSNHSTGRYEGYYVILRLTGRSGNGRLHNAQAWRS
jgi:hypothetical protein